MLKTEQSLSCTHSCSLCSCSASPSRQSGSQVIYRVSCPRPQPLGHGAAAGGLWHAQLCLTRRLAHSGCTDVPFLYGEEEAEKEIKITVRKLTPDACTAFHTVAGWVYWACTNITKLYKSMYVMLLNVLNIWTTPAVGTHFRISTDLIDSFIALENVCGFKSPHASISEHWVALESCGATDYCISVFRVLSSQKLYIHRK